MQPDFLFLLINFGILAPWALVILAPSSRPSSALLTSAWPFVLLGVGYGLVMVLAPMPPGGADLPSIRRVLGSAWGATAMWIHAITFDAFVGAWIVRDARRHAIRHRWIAPCLVLTLMFGPAGLLGYLLLRRLHAGPRELTEHEPSPSQ